MKKVELFKLAKVGLATCMFLFILLLTYWLHISFFKVNVVLYASIADVCIALAITSGVILFIKEFRVFSQLEIIILLALWFSIGYNLAISIPTVIDRSLSFYILEKIQQRGGGIKQDSIDRVFTEEYIKEHRLMDVRLTEQLESGTIKIENGCVKLTNRGKKIASFGRFFQKNFLPKKRLLMGEYSDDLTDPFRHSEKYMGYECP